MNTTTEKKRFTTRDVMVIAAMMVLTFAVYGAVGALTLPFPFLYLYCAAGIQEFFLRDILPRCCQSAEQTRDFDGMECRVWHHQCIGRLCIPASLFSAGRCNLRACDAGQGQLSEAFAQRHRVVLLWPRHDYRKHCSDLGCLGKLCGKGIHGRLFSGSL